MDCIYRHNGQCLRDVGGKRLACGRCSYCNSVERLGDCPWSVPDDGFDVKTSSIEKRAKWADVAAKAWAIIDTGDIEIMREDADEVEALVMSYEVQLMINPIDGKPFPVTDGGPYDVILSKRSWENSSNVGGWLQGFLCDCLWGQHHSGSPDDPGLWAGRLCSHAAAIVFALNIRARKDFMNDRTAGLLSPDEDLPMLHCVACGTTDGVDSSNGLCPECNAQRTFDNYVASVYCDDPVAERWLEVNGNPDTIDEITRAHVVGRIDDGVSTASWNGLTVLFTPTS